MESHHLSEVLGLVLCFGVLAQWLAWKTRIPSILMLSVVGLIIGPMTGLVIPSKDFGPALEPLIKLSLAIILFEGGLTLRFHELKEAGKGVQRLITWNSVFTWGLICVSARYVLEFSWGLAFLLSSILIVTGPTVILPLIKSVNVSRKAGSYLKWEGIVNDPIGVLITITFIEYYLYADHENAWQVFLINFGVAIVVSGVGTWLMMKTLKYLIQIGELPQYLKLPGILGAVIAVYTVANICQEEAGLLAVTLFGIILGNSDLSIVEETRRFKEYLTLLTVPLIFILLSANVEPTAIDYISWRSFAFFGLLVFVIRPIAVFGSTINSNMTTNEKIFVSLIAPRGIVTAALADFVIILLGEKGIFPHINEFKPMIFLVIFGTVILNSLYIGFLSKRLDLAVEGRKLLIVGSNPWTIDLCLALKELNLPVILADTEYAKLRAPKMQGIDTHYGEVLSNIMEEDMDLTDLSHCLAASQNNAYNSLVCTRYAHILGDHCVHQIHFDQKKEHEFTESLTGTTLGDESYAYGELVKNHFLGWKFKTIKITDPESGHYSKLLVNNEYKIILKLKADGKVIFNSSEYEMKVLPGDQLLVYYDGK